MKKLSKYLLVIMLSLFIIPLVNVNATSLNVKTINASISDNKISVDGTVDNGVLAVAIMVYDEAGTNLLKMQTTAVGVDDSFKDTINIKNGTYVVKAANYDGGTYITKTVAPATNTTETKDTTTDTKDTTTETAKKVSTGDEAHTALYASICALSIVGVGLLVLTKKRKDLLNK